MVKISWNCVEKHVNALAMAALAICTDICGPGIKHAE